MNTWHLQQAARAVHLGGVIAYPTEAVFGLGCDPWQPEAVFNLLALKQRPVEKGLILIAANTEQLAPFMAPLSESQWQTLKADWPGPATWVVPARAETPEWLRGSHQTIAVRVTAHPVARALCEACGHALVSSSANLAGRPPARSPLRVHQHFGVQLACIVNGPLGDATRPTRIRDLQSGKTLRAS